MIFFFLSCCEKAHDNKNLSHENSKIGCESQIMTYLFSQTLILKSNFCRLHIWQTLSGDLWLLNKVNSRLRVFYRQNKFLDIPLPISLCNALLQPFFDYAFNASYSNLNKNLKLCLQAAQNKGIRFCLKLGNRKSITVKEFKKNNLPWYW